MNEWRPLCYPSLVLLWQELGINPGHAHSLPLPSSPRGGHPRHRKCPPRRGHRWGTRVRRHEGPKREPGPPEMGPMEAWLKASRSAKGKQQLGPQRPDEAAPHGGEEKAGRPPVGAPQSHCERAICLRSQACPPDRLCPPPPRPSSLLELWEAEGFSQWRSHRRRQRWKKGPAPPGPCLPSSIKHSASRLGPEEGLPPGVRWTLRP